MAEFSNLCMHQIHESDMRFCAKCNSIILLQKSSLIKPNKPNNLYFNTEIDAIEHFKQIQKQQFIIQETFSISYQSVRRQMIQYLKRMCEKYKYTTRTLYLSIFYLDLLLKYRSIPSESKLDLIAISCMLLAGNKLYLTIS
jgi:hypothetical protein